MIRSTCNAKTAACGLVLLAALFSADVCSADDVRNDLTAASLKRVQQSLLAKYDNQSRNVPLDVKAKYFEWAIQKYHLAPWGHVHARVILSDKPGVDNPLDIPIYSDLSTACDAILADPI